MKMKRVVLLLAVMALGFSLFTGCTYKKLWVGNNIPGHFSATFEEFHGAEDSSISVSKGDTIAFEFTSEVKEGELTMVVKDPKGKNIAELETGTSGVKDVKVEKSGTYKLVVNGKKAGGSFEVKWKVK